MHPVTRIKFLLTIGLLFVTACGRQHPTHSPVDEGLVPQLLAAKTDEARRRLLQRGGPAASQAIMKAVLNQAEGFASRGELPKSLAAYDVAEFIANENSKSGNEGKGVSWESKCPLHARSAPLGS